MDINFLISFLFSSIALILFCKKKNFIVDLKLEKHKRHSSVSKSFSIGGILLLVYLLYYFLYLDNDYLIASFISSIFLIGFLSDIKKLNSVRLRFFLQVILIFAFTQTLDLEIISTKVDFIDLLLSNIYFNNVFVTFCLMVLINGGNFIDGLNTFLLSYFLSIYFVLLFFFGSQTSEDFQFLINLMIILIILISLNFSGIIYMGDSGAYLLSLITGIYLINFSTDNLDISPYLIVLFFWYPCFELLFSMIRRKIKQNETYKPDTKHLHQLLNDFIKNKIKKNQSYFTHTITSLIINSYNLLIFVISVQFIYSSEMLMLILIINIILYLYLYNLLSKKVIKTIH